MGFTKFTATALLAIGATLVTAGSVSAAPVTRTVTGHQDGVRYATGVTADGSAIATTLTAGHFSVSGDRKSVTITNSAGTVIASLPMAYQVAGQKFALTPVVSGQGRTLTLAPAGTPVATPAQKAAAQTQFVDKAADDIARHQYNAGVGALIGLGIGILIGLFFFGVGAIPGAVIGAGLGALIGWALP